MSICSVSELRHGGLQFSVSPFSPVQAPLPTCTSPPSSPPSPRHPAQTQAGSASLGKLVQYFATSKPASSRPCTDAPAGSGHANEHRWSYLAHSEAKSVISIETVATGCCEHGESLLNVAADQVDILLLVASIDSVVQMSGQSIDWLIESVVQPP